MTKLQKILLALLGLHLLLVTTGAFHFDAYRISPLIGTYAQLTGASSGYGFFAPGVGKGIRATFEISENGSITKLRLEPGVNREADLRVGNLLNALSRHLDDEKLRRSVSASLTAKVFSDHPEAQSIRIVLETVDIATMEEYRRGNTNIDWRKLYDATFTRNTQKGDITT